MKMQHKLLITISALFILSGTPQLAQALVLSPILTPDFAILLPPTPEQTSPVANERVVVNASSNNKREIVVMFNSNIEFVGSPTDAVQITNLETGTQIPLDTITINKNMLYIYSTAFAHNSTDGIRYNAHIAANQIRRIGGAVMTESLGWMFTLADGIDTLFPIAIHERLPKITIEKILFTPHNVTFSGAEDQTATYRMTVTNNSESYSVHNITVHDVLPSGFIYDHLVFGSGISETGTSNLTFSIAGDLAAGSSKIFDFSVRIPNSVANGTYDNGAIVQADFNPEGLNSDRYTVPTISSFDSNTDSDEDIVITHTVVSPSPSTTPSPTPTSTSSSTPSSSAFSHPTTDPLTCLHLNGADTMHFSDVSSSLIEAPYINFLNTTTFYTNPDIRLSRGYSDGTFGTNNTLTRFELTKMALGANCINYNTSPAPNHYFTDVPTDNSEVSLVIGKAKALGIVQGVGTNFYPNRPVTYGEMVKILVGSGIYFDHGTPATVLSTTLSGISDESFRQFAEYGARMNLVNLSGSTFPQNDFVQRKFMAQAVARYIAWLKNISLI